MLATIHVELRKRKFDQHVNMHGCGSLTFSARVCVCVCVHVCVRACVCVCVWYAINQALYHCIDTENQTVILKQILTCSYVNCSV